MNGLIAVTVFVVSCLLLTGCITYIHLVWRGIPQLLAFIMYLTGSSGLLIAYTSIYHYKNDKRRAYWLMFIGTCMILVAVYAMETWLRTR